MLKQSVNKIQFNTRYFLLVLVTVIFSISLYIIYNGARVRTIESYNREQLNLARTASEGISSFFNGYSSNLEFLSGLAEVIDLNDYGKDILKKFYETHSEDISAITRMDSTGSIIYTYPINESVVGTSISYQDHVAQLLTTRKPVVSDVFMAAQGYRAIALHIPVFNEGYFSGSIAVLIPFDELGKSYIGDIEKIGTGNAWLMSEKGIEIYCPVEGHTGKSYIDLSGDTPENEQFLAQIKLKSSGYLKAVHKSGPGDEVEKYIVYNRARLVNSYWTVLISYSEKDIFSALKKLRNQLTIVFLILIITIVFYFMTLSRVKNVLNAEARRNVAEKTLKESEEKFRKIFEDHAAVKMLLEPSTGRILDANKAAEEFYGWTRDELKQMTIRQINTLTPEEIASKIDSVINDKRIRFEFLHRLKDGSLREVEVFSSKISVGGLDFLHSVIHDITDRKEAEKALVSAKEKAEESDRLKTSFLQNMSHEIRTPMNAIMGFTSLLKDSFDNKEELEQFANAITKRSNDLLKIIDDLLVFSRIDSGELPVSIEEFDLKELFNELSEQPAKEDNGSGKKNIELNFEIKGDTPPGMITTDRLKLKQILINLITNAYKFTDEGRIDISAESDDKGVLTFMVADTGIGIPESQFETIFERFYQIEHTRPHNAGGTGLGLAIVKGLVSLLGGTIWLTSREGSGTTFFFTIKTNRED